MCQNWHNQRASNWVQMGQKCPKIDPNGSKLIEISLNGHKFEKLVPKWVQSGSKVGPKWVQSGSKVGPKWIENGSKLAPNGSKKLEMNPWVKVR